MKKKKINKEEEYVATISLIWNACTTDNQKRRKNKSHEIPISISHISKLIEFISYLLEWCWSRARHNHPIGNFPWAVRKWRKMKCFANFRLKIHHGDIYRFQLDNIFTMTTIFCASNVHIANRTGRTRLA